VTLLTILAPHATSTTPGASSALPTPSDVALILRGRLRVLGGAVPDTWTADTNPTRTQVQGIIDLQAPLVLVQTGNVDGLTCADADTVRNAVKAIIAQRVALVIEMGYWAEEIEASGRDLSREWRDLNDTDLKAVVEAARECRQGEVLPGGDGPGEGGIALAPAFGFEQQLQRLSF
jgi:hypothetical protein